MLTFWITYSTLGLITVMFLGREIVDGLAFAINHEESLKKLIDEAAGEDEAVALLHLIAILLMTYIAFIWPLMLMSYMKERR